MAEKERKTNAEAVKDYHKKLVNLATIRVPSEEVSGVDFKAEILSFLCEKYGEKKPGTPNISMNEYVLNLIEEDMKNWQNENQSIRSEVVIARGVKEVKKVTIDI